MATSVIKTDSIPYNKPKKVGSFVTISNTTGTTYAVPSDGLLVLMHETGTTGYIRVFYDIPGPSGGGRIVAYFNPNGSYDYNVVPVYAGCTINVAGVSGENNYIRYFPFVE